MVAVTVAVAILGLTASLAHFENMRFRQNERTQVLYQLSYVRAKLESAINVRLQMVDVISAHASLHPQITQAEFAKIASVMMRRYEGIWGISLAQNNIISHAYPLLPNEKSLGIHLADIPGQMPAIERSIREHKTILAGPVVLKEGGSAFIGRAPIFYENGNYWGLASVLVDPIALYAETGLLDKSDQLKFLLRGVDGLGDKGEIFFGSQEILKQQPVVVNVILSNGSWQLAAIPVGGWQPYSTYQIWVWSIGVMLALFTALASYTLILTNSRLQAEILQRLQTEAQLSASNQELQKLVKIDGLTHIANRHYFDQYLHQQWLQMERERHPLSLIIFDVDFFKRYNDHYGHLAGDVCLEKIAQAAKKALKRPADLVARYGGEEFAIVLHNTDQVGAIYVAEQVQQAIRNLAIPHEYSDASDIVSVSLGVACMIPNKKRHEKELINDADKAMYLAKEQGRNRYVFSKAT